MVSRKPSGKRYSGFDSRTVHRMLDFYASERHYIDHVASVWRALDPDLRGIFRVRTEELQLYAKTAGVTAEVSEPTDQLTLVASYGDYKRTSGPVIYMEHGIGHSYGNNHPSYAGGAGKYRVVLFLCQHDYTAEKNKKTYPKTPVAVIGTPKLDRIKKRGVEGRTVAISWHWDCQIAPETKSSLPHFRPLLNILKRAKDIELIGHAHPNPRFNKVMQRMYSQLGIEYVHNFKEVLDRADLYIVDNSSTAYEFAAAGRPVIHLNAPWYRKEVSHGIRFWDYIPGPTADQVREVLPLIRQLLDDPTPYEKQRKAVVKALYPHKGKASKVAAEEIKNFLCR
jgi:hypothetical protein